MARSIGLELSRLFADSSKEELESFGHAAEAEAVDFERRCRDPLLGNAELRDSFALTSGHPAYQVVLEWLQTRPGRQFSADLTDSALTLIAAFNRTGFPGHDLRHILVKTPIAALKYAHENKLDAVQELLMIPVLMHDLGRLAEPIIFGRTLTGEKAGYHAVFGAFAARMLLEGHIVDSGADGLLRDALQVLSDELVNAVLSHQAGTCRRSFFARITQDLDRLQLVGSEMVLRSLGCDVGLHGCSMAGPFTPGMHKDGQGRKSFLQQLERYMRVFSREVNPAMRGAFEEKIAETGLFLTFSSDREQHLKIFAPDISPNLAAPKSPAWLKNFSASASYDANGIGYRKSYTRLPLDAAHWKRIRSGISEETMSKVRRLSAAHTLDEIVFGLLSSPNAAGNREMVENVRAEISRISPEESFRYRDSIAYAWLLTKEADWQDAVAVKQAVKSYSSTQWSPMYRAAAAIEPFVSPNQINHWAAESR